VSVANGVLHNDVDPAGLDLSVTNTGTHSTSHGSVTINGDGSFAYTPATGYVGNDSFTYSVTNTNQVASATLGIDVIDVPVSTVEEHYKVDNTGHASGSASGTGSLGANDDNTSGGTLTYHLTPNGGVTRGTLTLNSDGSFTYVAGSNFKGFDQFHYIVNDGY